ncbi:hypothetical protein OAL49_01835, partial [Gammaproteobacteria bacterium]|nr:hypothetical protein [Gammaproteobacteria bacterium]
NLVVGALLCILLLILSFCISFAINQYFILIICGYTFLTLGYSFYLKKLLLLDIFLLSTLYTLRLLGGGVAISVELSNWLLTFSIFIFLSLGTLKRYTDTSSVAQSKTGKLAHGRSYILEDLPGLQILGISSGIISVFVFLLYAASDEIAMFYRSPIYLWISSIVLAYWIVNIWFLASRGLVKGDPILFALKDKNSIASIFIVVILIAAAIKL